MRSWLARAMLPLLILAPPCRVARGQEPTSPLLASDQAVRLGHSALQKYENRAFREAYAELEAADRLAHSPVFVLYMARSQRELGELAAANALYLAILGERLPADAPPVFRDAVDAARSELGELSSRTASVPVTSLPSVPTAQGRPGMAGVPLGSERLSGPLELNVSGHQIQESRPRAAALSKAEPAHGSASLPPLVAFSVGVAGVLAGTICGLVASSELSKLRADCPDNHCRASDRDRRDHVNALADVSTIGFLIGGAGIGTGLILTFALPPASPVGRSAAPAAALTLRGAW